VFARKFATHANNEVDDDVKALIQMLYREFTEDVLPSEDIIWVNGPSDLPGFSAMIDADNGCLHHLVHYLSCTEQEYLDTAHTISNDVAVFDGLFELNNSVRAMEYYMRELGIPCFIQI